MDRYHRQKLVPEIGIASQEVFADASVLIIGMGGLGCPIARTLSGAGIGRLTLVDHDDVSLSNLHRQNLYTEAHIGIPKVRVAEEILSETNSSISISGVSEKLSPSNARVLIESHSLIIDAADSFVVSYLLSDLCTQLGKPMISGSVLKTSGYLGVFCGTKEHPAPSYRAIFPKPPMVSQNCESAGVTGPAVGVIANLMAQEAFKVLLDDSETLWGKVLTMELWNYAMQVVDFSKAPEPLRYSPIQNASEISDEGLILDVRSESEAANQPFENVDINIPLNQLSARLNELNKHRWIGCRCLSGHRALIAAQTLLEADFGNVVVLV